MCVGNDDNTNIMCVNTINTNIYQNKNKKKSNQFDFFDVKKNQKPYTLLCVLTQLILTSCVSTQLILISCVLTQLILVLCVLVMMIMVSIMIIHSENLIFVSKNKKTKYSLFKTIC